MKNCISKYPNLGKVIYMSSILMILLSATNSGLGIISEIFDQRGYKNLGNISVLILFIFSGIFALIVPYYISRFKFKILFFFSSIGYTAFLAQGILVTSCPIKNQNQLIEQDQIQQQNSNNYFYCQSSFMYPIVILFSAIMGTLNIVFYLSQNEYVSEMSNLENKGVYFGTSMALLQLSLAFGNIYSAFLIVPLNQLNFFIFLTLIVVLSSLFFFFLKEPIDNNKSLQQQTNSIQKMDNDQTSLRQNLEEVWKLSKNPLLYQLYPFFIQSGLVLSFMFGILFLLVSQSLADQKLTNEQINQKTFFVNINLGIFECIGGILVGPLTDKYGLKFSAKISNIFFQLSILASLMSHFFKSYLFCFVASALWGMSDCTSQSINCSIISTMFGDNVKAFGIYNFFQSFSACIGMIMSIIFKEIDLTIYLSILFLIQMIINFSLDFLKISPKNYEQI